MKNLDFEQMENLVGGEAKRPTNRECMLDGAGFLVGVSLVIAGQFWGGTIAAGGFYSGVNAGCFG